MIKGNKTIEDITLQLLEEIGENPKREGPLRESTTHSKSVPLRARLAREFLTTRSRTAFSRAVFLKPVISLTVTPSESAITREKASAAISLTSATIAFFSSS